MATIKTMEQTQIEAKVVYKNIEIGVGTAVALVVSVLLLCLGILSFLTSSISETEERLNEKIDKIDTSINTRIDRVETRIIERLDVIENKIDNQS